MVWSDLNTTYSPSVTGMMDLANSNTGYWLGPVIMMIAYVIGFMANRTSPRNGAVSAGFLCMITGFFMKWTLASFSDGYVLLGIGAFVAGLLALMFIKGD